MKAERKIRVFLPDAYLSMDHGHNIAVRTNSVPAVTGEDGAAAVELAERIVEAIRSPKWPPKT